MSLMQLEEKMTNHKYCLSSPECLPLRLFVCVCLPFSFIWKSKRPLHSLRYGEYTHLNKILLYAKEVRICVCVYKGKNLKKICFLSVASFIFSLTRSVCFIEYYK